MSYPDDTPSDPVLIDDLVERWRLLATRCRATIDQLDRDLEEFTALAERTTTAWRSLSAAVTVGDRDEQYEAWCVMIGLDAVDSMLCDLAGRIQSA